MIIDENDIINVLKEYNDYSRITYIGRNLDGCFLFRIVKGIKAWSCTHEDCKSCIYSKIVGEQVELLNYE